MTVNGRPCSRTTDPDDAGIRADPGPQARESARSLSSRGSSASSGTKPRPSAGLTPSSSNRFGEARDTAISIGSLPSRSAKIPPRKALQARRVFDDGARLLQLDDVGSEQRTSAQIHTWSVITPDEKQIAGILVGHRVDQNFLMAVYTTANMPSPTVKRADRRHCEHRSTHAAGATRVPRRGPNCPRAAMTRRAACARRGRCVSNRRAREATPSRAAIPPFFVASRARSMYASTTARPISSRKSGGYSTLQQPKPAL